MVHLTLTSLVLKLNQTLSWATDHFKRVIKQFFFIEFGMTALGPICKVKALVLLEYKEHYSTNVGYYAGL